MTRPRRIHAARRTSWTWRSRRDRTCRCTSLRNGAGANPGVVEQGLEFGFCLLGGYSGLEPGKGPHGMAGIGVALRGRVERLGQEYIGSLQSRHLEVPRQHTYNFRSMSVDLHQFAEHAWVQAKTAAPQSI